MLFLSIPSSISLYRMQAINNDMDIGYNLFWRSTKIENIILDSMLKLLFDLNKNK